MEVYWRLLGVCYVYCLMLDHSRLVVETPEENLSKSMRQVKG